MNEVATYFPQRTLPRCKTADMKRAVIVGAPGSGKSTLARSLGERLSLPVFERDAHGVLGSPDFEEAVAAMLKTDAWIFDGFPYFVDEDVYEAADTVIALDYPRRVVLGRVMRRSLSLARGRHHGAHPNAGIGSWFAKDHAVRVAWTRYGDRKQEMRELADRPELADTQVIRLRTPSETTAWLCAQSVV